MRIYPSLQPGNYVRAPEIPGMPVVLFWKNWLLLIVHGNEQQWLHRPQTIPEVDNALQSTLLPSVRRVQTHPYASKGGKLSTYAILLLPCSRQTKNRHPPPHDICRRISINGPFAGYLLRPGEQKVSEVHRIGNTASCFAKNWLNRALANHTKRTSFFALVVSCKATWNGPAMTDIMLLDFADLLIRQRFALPFHLKSFNYPFFNLKRTQGAQRQT